MIVRTKGGLRQIVSEEILNALAVVCHGNLNSDSARLLLVLVETLTHKISCLHHKTSAHGRHSESCKFGSPE